MLKKSRKIPLVTGAMALALASCGNINNSWEVKGGGYFKYSINGGEKYTINLEREDCEPTQYNRHYFTCNTQIDMSKQGDQFALMVNNPSTGGKLKPVSVAFVNGKEQRVTWMRQKFSIEAPLIEDSSYIHFDEIIRDSLWTANVEFYFKDCRSGDCEDDLPPLHISGRLRYWVAVEDR